MILDTFVDAAQADLRLIPVSPVTPDTLDSKLGSAPEARAWTASHGFEGKPGQSLVMPGTGGGVERVLFGVPDEPTLWDWAALVPTLPVSSPPAVFQIQDVDPDQANRAALGWALACYRFTRYKAAETDLPRCAWPEGADREAVTRQAEAIALARDMVNTPAEDMGPAELAGTIEGVAGRHGAQFTCIEGEDLLTQNYPCIHAVGRAADRAPRLADLTWGDEDAPKITLVGKGVVFDSGGLDLKPSAGMKLMKKDMGGSASALALAHAVMAAGLSVRLRLLVPCVENAVSGNAFRPLDVLNTRKGKTVEVGNTDAEGRLVLADALAEADGESPDLILDFATLTGAARVALGTELPALFCNDDAWADAYLAAGRSVTDPLWRMPLHEPYRRFIDSPVADLNNIGTTGMGGAITAALFLREFISNNQAWAHVDTMGWTDSAQAGRPVGGDAFGVRAALAMLEERYGA
ncbi:MAG TPA: leucyl aminopeptidase family protein [Planctomycetes bacterium]|nr:leucyl aminopeptidase family protein [Planctomycetota bacterium]HIK59912.1 leucyl aminopeptidase family protein [Planctomycetota bacterium]